MEKKFSRKYIGKECKTNEGYIAKVVDGGSTENYCTIEIEGKWWEVQVSNLKKGEVKNPWHPSVCGVGYIGTSENSIVVKNKEAYSRWKNMLERCYDPKFQAKKPTYKGCTVVKEWHSFYNFLQWYKENVRLDTSRIKYHLDKDLLSYGNSKHYGPDTCIFIPAQVNTFLANVQSDNTSGYTGVSYYKSTNKYVSRINIFDPFEEKHEQKYLGLYETAKQASNAYKMARIQEAKKVKNWMISLGYSPYICGKII